MRRMMRGSYAVPKTSSSSRCEPTTAFFGRRLRSSSSKSSWSAVVISLSRHQRRVDIGPHLQVVQRLIAPTSRQQLEVRAAFDDMTVLDEQDLVGMHQRAQPMRDDDGHPTLGEFPHREADTLLGGRIDGGG